MKRSVFIMLLLGCFISCNNSNNTEIKKTSPELINSTSQAETLYETWLKTVIDYEQLPGTAVAIIYDQEIVYAKEFGYSDLSNKVPIAPETVFMIASVSKLFTATAIFILRAEGKLELSDPVSKHLPWFTPEKSNPQLTVQPTIGDLLRHSSGLPCEPDMIAWHDQQDMFPDRDELIERLNNIEMFGNPNETYNYSNLGYALLGEIIEACSGEAYTDYIKNNILQPIDMSSTFCERDENFTNSPVAKGYGRRLRNNLKRNEIKPLNNNSMVPAFGYYSNVPDLAAFAMWQFRVLSDSDSSIIDKKSLIEMHSTQWEQPRWGYGYTKWTFEGKEFVGHYGGMPGYKSQIIICPEDKLAVIVLCNASDAPMNTMAFEAYYTIGREQISKSDGNERKLTGQWSKYTGFYTADRSWADAEVVEWEGSLNVMWLPAYSSAFSLTKLKHIHDEIFREVQSDGSYGKFYSFGTDANGNIVSMKFNNNLLDKAY